MKQSFNKKNIVYIIIAIAIIAVTILKLKNNKEITENKVYQYNKQQAINVTVDTLKLEDLSSDFSYSGTFEANKETKISAEIPGKINSITTDVGHFVAKGQSLLVLDNSLLKLQLQAIDVQIQNAKVEYDVQTNANQIQIDELIKDVNRYTILAQSDAIQGIQLEKAEMQLKIAQNQRVAILQQSGLKTAEAQRKNIIEQINKTTIRSPFSGIVTMKFTEVGGFAAPGIPLLQVTDLSSLKFTINVPENELSQFQIGKTYNVFSDVYPNQILSGKTTMIGSKANMGSSFPIQFEVINTSDLKIKSGMFGRVQIKNNNEQKEIIISSSTIQGSANQAQVYLIKDGKAMLQDISITKRLQNKVVVSSGLKAGDVIVTNGFINLFDGANATAK